MRLAELVEELERQTGGNFEVNNGICALKIDDMSVSLQEIDEVGLISMYAEIGEPPPQHLENLYESMLMANHLFMATAGSTLSLDPETRRFYLCRVDASDSLSSERFCKMLEQFINTLEKWRKLVADFREEAASVPAEENISAFPDFGGAFGGFMQV